MGTEQDKTNAAVVATMLALGAAAMVGGSAALVALARGEIRDVSAESEGFANLESVHDLKAAQRARLSAGKLPIDKAKAMVVAQIKADPNSASPAPPPPPVEPAPSGSADGLTPAPSGSGEATPAPSASGGEAPAASGSSAPAEPEQGKAPEPTHSEKGEPAPSATH
ncbi:MAG TPA: hypothetical protein VHM70_23885 [Polyangiaceae bacterium]|jgi:hypothetical protein|nr:hypothetical protein [Polyangiaceae bacterium]